MPSGRGATPPKAGPGTAGILPARFRASRHCREGRGRYAPPANDRNCRAPRIPAMPRNGAPARSGALPGCAGVPARTFPPATASAGKRERRFSLRRNPAEGGAWVRGRLARTFPPTAASAGRRERQAAQLRNRASPAELRRSPPTRPRRRRGPGPRASSPHVPARRGIAGKGAVVALLPPMIGTVEPRGSPQCPAKAPQPAPARFLGARASPPARRRPARCRRGEARSSPCAARRLRPHAACRILTTSVWRPFPPRSAPS